MIQQMKEEIQSDTVMPSQHHHQYQLHRDLPQSSVPAVGQVWHESLPVVDEHSPRLSKFVPDRRPESAVDDRTPRLSKFVPTEAHTEASTTVSTPRLSQFCPGISGLNKSVNSSGK